MNYLDIKNKSKEDYLRDKYKNKEYSKKWKPLRISSNPTTIGIQAITSLLACALPAWLIQVITGSWYTGFLLGGIVMFVIEYWKRYIVNHATIGIIKAKYGIDKFPVSTTFAALLFLGVSMASSGIGTPILVENFAPMPVQPSQEAIKTPYADRKSQAVQYWQEVKESALSKAKEVHSKNNWKGVTVKGARSSVLAYEMQAKASTDSLNAALAKIEAEQSAALSKANEDYITSTSKRTTQKSSVGYWLMFVTLFLELCFIGCYAWLNYYDFREAAELGLVSAGSTEESKRRSTIKPKEVKESNVPQQRTANAIGFNNEGKVLDEGGKLKILCKTRNGLKAYDSSYLSKLVSSTQGQPKHSYWVDMRDKLKNAK
jgi:hypothetical protein